MRHSAADTVLLAGHSCVDLIPALTANPTVGAGEFSNVGPLEVRCGGSVINTGEALAALGRSIRVVTSVGRDHLGGVLGEKVRRLDPDAVLEVGEFGTSYSIVLEHDGGSRTIWHHEGSNVGFDGRRVDPTGVALVHLGYATALPGLMTFGAQPFTDLLERVTAAGATTSVDFATLDPRAAGAASWPELLRRLLPLMDVVSPSADDLVSMGWLDFAPDRDQIAEAARQLVDAGAAIAFVTDGERGAHLSAGDGERLARGGLALDRLGAEWAGADEWTPAVRVERVVGTNGAGDTATAGLIHALLSGYTPREAGRFAVELAARRVAGLELYDSDA